MVTTHTVDELLVQIHPSTAAMAAAAADDAIALLAEVLATRPVAHVMFATGNSQLAFVEILAERTRDFPWERVIAFHMDEYVGLGPEHPASFQRWIRERIEGGLHPGAVHYFSGTADPDEECARYAALLEEFPLDLCCLGIGENGHLAFNDPGVADFSDPLDVKVVELDTACRTQQVNEGHFPSIDAVPSHAMTVTIPALLRASRVFAIVPEGRKAVPVRGAVEGAIEEACPASALRTCVGATLYLDADSGGLLTGI